jgi:hypothetical protein
MSPKSRQALVLLAAALALGGAADLLGRTLPDRAGLASWIALALAVGAMLVRAGVVRVPRESFGLGAAALLFTCALIGRDAEPLFALNLLAALACVVLAAPRARPAGLGSDGVTDYVRAAVDSAANSLAGVLPAAAMDIEWHAIGGGRRTRSLLAAGAGLLAVIPVLVLFGNLFSQADPLFERTMRWVLYFNLDAIAPHLVTIGVATWVTAGFLRWAFVRRPYTTPAVPTAPRVGIAAVGTATGAVALLFLLFVVLQARYLFGGDALVRGPTVLSYAEYARRGFFELAWVAGLSLPLLLFAEWLLDKDDRRGMSTFRALAAVVVALLGVIVASALFRMRLYVAAYGLTEARLYVTVFMLWLTVVFAWFAATVLRGRRPRFAAGAVGAALASVLMLNVINPDAVIARSNLARAGGPARFDAAYVAGLSADALPVVFAALPALAAGDQCALGRGLRERWKGRRAGSDWNLARLRARDRIAEARRPPAAMCPAPSP